MPSLQLQIAPWPVPETASIILPDGTTSEVALSLLAPEAIEALLGEFADNVMKQLT